MKKLHIYLIALSGLFLLPFFYGCPQTGAPSVVSTAKGPKYTVSIQDAAEQLGLTVQKDDYPYLELTGSNNRVLVFLYENGRVYVNGTPVAQAGKIYEISGTYYISEQLIPKIRAAMTAATAYVPAPSITTPTLPSPIKSGLIVVDPGHGGNDPGTKSDSGVLEKGINLKIAFKLTEILRQAGYRVMMTRDDDSSIDKYERAELSNRVGADLFVSIHCDWNNTSSHQGTTVYIARQPSWTSKKIARQIETTLSNSGIPGRGLSNGDYVVLVQTQCPAVLVECGFMSNYEDAKNLTNSWYQGKLARAIADGIIQSF